MAKLSVIQLLKNYDPTLDTDRATSLVICKNVYVNGELCTDSKSVFDKNSKVEVLFPKYVSRGGFKLEAALENFQFNVKDLVVLDAGSSTGGFTDCLLQNGAKAVHCVDVGYNLLDFKIRSDKRVFVHEKTNIMAVQSLDPQPDVAVADLSFRSIKGAALHVLDLTKTRKMVALIKPQFEVPKWVENFNGVISDPKLLKDTMGNVYSILSQENIGIFNIVKSPITGHKGNTEFLALLEDHNENALSLDQFLATISLK